MPIFEVPIQVPFDLDWKLRRKDLNFKFQTQTKLIFHNHCRYMVRVLWRHYSSYSDTRAITGTVAPVNP
jgi:hypothetical protein